MKEMKQTNRTMLMGIISPDDPDFMTEVGEQNGAEALTDEHLKNTNEKLLVYSYSEFEKKFIPKAYGIVDSETGKMVFTLRKPEHIPEHLVTEYPLGIKSPTTGVLFNMLDAKSKQGARNVEFDFQAITSQLSPQKQQAVIRQVRKELVHKFVQLEEKLPDDPARDDIAIELNALMEQARGYFHNPTSMLALAASDSEQRLLLGAEGDQDKKNKKITAGVLSFDDKGSIKVLSAPKVDEKALALTEGKTSTALAGILEQDYKETAGDQASNYMKELVVRTFSPLATTAQEDYDLAEEVEKYNSYLNMYTEAQKEFMKVVKPVIEQLLGVYVFFQQYKNTVSNKSGMRPSLLVTNCDPELLAMSRNITRLETYLATTNNTNHYDDTVWNAIFPNLAFSKTDEIKVTKEVFKVNKEAKKSNVYSIEVLGTLLDCFSKYQVRTFFGFENGEETNFDRVAKEGIGAFASRCETLSDRDFSSFAVPCLPNITIIPKNKSGVITGTLLETDGDTVSKSREREDIQRFYLNGIYVNAAFAAAGITAAYQCPEFLAEKFGKNVDPELPGVRFDIEFANNSLAVPTTLAKEVAGFTENVKQEINRNSFGFILGSETQSYKGKSVSKLTVYKARTLAFDGRQYEPLFQTYVTSFFERILRQITGDNKMDNIKYFFSANPASQMSKWREKQDRINAVIQNGDEITYELDADGNNCEIKFSFGGVQKNMKVQLQRSSKKVTA